MSEIRTFIAIEINESVHREIAHVQEDLKKAKERISWNKPTNIHLTMKFLGAVEENKIEPIAGVINNIAKDTPAFTTHVKNLGAFPNFRRPRVLWVGVENALEQFREIARNIENELSSLGFTKENRKFTPHLTIGRVKSLPSKQFIEKVKNYDFVGGEIHVREIVVMKSDLRPTGAVYTPLKKIELTHIS